MGDFFTPKERLLRTLNKKGVERPPVICPGGMMNSAIVEIMETTGHTLPDAHRDWRLMSQLADDVFNLTGFENIGIPFCMTVEAEALGSEVDLGSLKCEPKIAREPYASVDNVDFLPVSAVAKSPRTEIVIQSIASLSKKQPDVPVIGSVTGPVSTAASITDPMTFLKELYKNKDMTHKVLDYVTDALIEYARLLVDNGAAVISIADPTATGEILGPRIFAEYAVTYLNKLADSIHKLGVPVIIHICGKVGSVTGNLKDLRCDAISTDAMVNLHSLKEELKDTTVMGNISTYLLEFGNEESVRQNTSRLVEKGIDIIAPACGLSTSTSLKNIRALTGAVSGGVYHA
ncbi:uroporphyrinogen decarboxylase [Oxobacter pfennigii]|uniref:Uroporphyrinogen decarboxylase n=1 Tax=Oxobacter pfennigii TaxID=36849 RepID=A0A0P9AI15_9CLOT|nr:MtaA/CmuA family methyltransferase [Oxobacter pfennigii]KPU45098.1 uroporphyrinogen decarboxylase [Oxobacter pfennigii]